MKKINWDAMPVTAKDEIKGAIQSLITLLMRCDEFIKEEGFDRLIKEDLVCYQFALLTADFQNTIRIGKIIEKAYYDWTEAFTVEISYGPY